jgi:hypothetical protein
MRRPTPVLAWSVTAADWDYPALALLGTHVPAESIEQLRSFRRVRVQRGASTAQ